METTANLHGVTVTVKNKQAEITHDGSTLFKTQTNYTLNCEQAYELWTYSLDDLDGSAQAGGHNIYRGNVVYVSHVDADGRWCKTVSYETGEMETIFIGCECNFLPNNRPVPDIAYKQLDVIRAAAYADSKKMSRRAWEEDRRNGFGGSDIAPIMGDSKFSDNLNVFLDKTRLGKQDLSDKWFSLEYGHAVEAVVAKCFAKKMRAMVINETGMFKHPEYDFIRANLDRLAVLPDGELVIVEAKSTNSFSARDWAVGPPVYYEWQGRQYLYVINSILEAAKLPIITTVYYVCSSGNSENDVLIRKLRLDKEIEHKMVETEKEYWLNYIIPQKLPDFNGAHSQLFQKMIAHQKQLARLNGVQNIADVKIIESDLAAIIVDSIKVIKNAEKEHNATLKNLKEQRAALETSLIKMMEGSAKAVLESGITLEISHKFSRSVNYQLLEEIYPEAYADCVSTTQSNGTLSIKLPKKKSGKNTKLEVSQKEEVA